MAKSKTNNKETAKEFANDKIGLRATKIEGSIITLKDSTPQATGSYSIAQVVIFSNEEPLVVVDRFTPQLKTLKQLKDYYGVDTKTYKFVENMFAQNPCFCNVSGFSFLIVPVNYTNATGYKVLSTQCSLANFKSLNNASLRLKFEGAVTSLKYKELNEINDIDKKVEFLSRKGFKNFYKDNIVEEKEDKLYKVVLRGSNAVSNATHYKEVNEMDFTDCDDMDDVCTILNNAGFDFVNFTYEDNKLVATSKALGEIYEVSVQTAQNVGTGVDLQSVIFGAPTPATTISGAIVDLARFQAVNKGILTIETDAGEYTTSEIDFTTCVTQNDVAIAINSAINGHGATCELLSSNRIQFKSSLTGSTAKVELKETEVVTAEQVDLYGVDYLNGANQIKGEGGDGMTTEDGANGSGDDIIDLYNTYSSDPTFNGDVLSSIMELSVDEIFNLNTKIKISLTQGNRVIMVHSIPHPYMSEATSHGTQLDWLRSDLLSIYCGLFTGQANLDLRSAVLSMGVGQNVLGSNVTTDQKNDLHMKDVTIPNAKVGQSMDNEILDLIGSNGCGGCSYFKQGFGWKLTIPKADDCYTWSDAVNMQNIMKTFAITLANGLASRKYSNKTNDNIEYFHNLLYAKCLYLTKNGVLTGDISDSTISSQVPVNVETAKKYIQETEYHCYIYTPDATEITGKIIPITCYMGFAGSIYGFTLENVYLS